MAPFRFNAQKVFLTYAQCGEMTKEDVMETLVNRYACTKWMLGEEEHADGGRHIHAYFEFSKKLNLKTQDCFDVNTGENQYHPNIKSVSRGKANIEKVLKYIQKEDPCVLTNIDPTLTWAEIKDQASDAEEYLTLVEKHYPRDAALAWDRLKSYAEQRYNGEDPNTLNDFEAHEGWVCPDDLLNLEVNALKSLVVIGPAGCGKTTWAKTFAKKPILFISHMDGLRKLTKKHQSIIFDDMDFKHYPLQAQKHLLDQENPREIHIRYRTAVIPAGMQKIFTANSYPFYEEREDEHYKAILRRMQKIELY